MNFNQKCADDIRLIIAEARQKAYKATINAMVDAYWLIGKHMRRRRIAGIRKSHLWQRNAIEFIQGARNRIWNKKFERLQAILPHLQRLGDLAHTVRQIELVQYSIGNESYRPSRTSLLS